MINSKRIRADSARVDWSKAFLASSVQVPKSWGLVRSRSINFLDWTWTRLDGSSPDWSSAGLVESLIRPVGNNGHVWPLLPFVSLQLEFIAVVGGLRLSVIIVLLVVFIVGLQNFVGLDRKCTSRCATNRRCEFSIERNLQS
jgi:hypothetical protein